MSEFTTRTNSHVLREKMRILRGPLNGSFQRFWQSGHLDQRVPAFLILTHQVIRASVPLMETARARAAEAGPDDPVCAGLAKYLAMHIEEERNHDEWLLEDLETAGIDRAAVAARVPPANVASLVGAQYYWIHHCHPVALLGYIAVLEGTPPSLAHMDRLQRESGLPASAFRTFRLHAELDPHHMRDFDQMLDSLPLSASQESLVGISAINTTYLLAECLGEVALRERSPIDITKETDRNPSRSERPTV